MQKRTVTLQRRNANGNNVLQLYNQKHHAFEGLLKAEVWAKESPTLQQGNSDFGLRKPQEREKHGKWAFPAINYAFEFCLHTLKPPSNLFLKLS